MATVPTIPDTRRAIGRLGAWAAEGIAVLGDWSIFAARTLAWTVRRLPSRGTMVPICYFVGVRSVGVILVTGLFIGMVMSVQVYSQFNRLGLTGWLGSLINVSVIRELGPVLAASMIAGRVGSAMAAELATMRITEQIDALACLGVNPVHYLVVPRFLACLLLTPLLTTLADFMGVTGGALLCIKVYGVDSYQYWQHSHEYVEMWDVNCGLLKSMFFGAAIALIACHRGFNSKPGAAGVGQAATETFVTSFIVILVLDFFLALLMNALYERLWPLTGQRVL